VIHSPEIAMNRTLSLIAGALAACATSMAFAQAPQPADQPIASTTIASTTIPAGDGEDAALLDSITRALNAESTLKDSKITVQMDGDHVLLTGATTTPELVERATSIATTAAGDQRQVVNVMLPDKGNYRTWQRIG
jgi:osmotically-inducible protein OsmY